MKGAEEQICKIINKFQINLIFTLIWHRLSLEKKNLIQRTSVFIQKRQLFIIYNMHKMKRELWTQREDQILSSFVFSGEENTINTKWTEISASLKMLHPGWTRDPKQCRERWNNYLDPFLNTMSKSIETDDPFDAQKFLNCFKLYGKKWSLMKRKQFPGKSESSLKNYFYVSLRKGLKNLNYFNREVRTKKVFKGFNRQFLDRVLAVNDEKKCEDLIIFDQSVKQIGKKIIDILFQSSQHQKVSLEDLQFYETMHETLVDFGKKCRFKKLKKGANKKKNDQVVFNFLSRSEISSRKPCEKRPRNRTEQKGTQIQPVSTQNQFGLMKEVAEKEPEPTCIIENLRQNYLSTYSLAEKTNFEDEQLFDVLN